MPIEIRELVIKAAVSGGSRVIEARITDGSKTRGVNALVAQDGVELARKLIVRGLPAGWDGTFEVHGLGGGHTSALSFVEGKTSGDIPASKLQRELARGGLVRARVVAHRSPVAAHEMMHAVQQKRASPLR
ncbi:MAG: hypothetical protein JJU42_16245 [Rhodobacteraceae bacterium]|nr:hypothetical protein [Paracoccaceae bacterium]